ncbi:MAG: peptide/nickel transport system ATP-binding protein [Pseudonocardiales bacterium]|nr:peptide/nickel transport system ATP-binding protein [Pseudonocardiales bacterium]
MTALVELQDVSVDYVGHGGSVSAVQNVSLTLGENETFGLVGESGCGKTTLSMALMGLLPASARVTGQLLFRGQDLLAMSEAERRQQRGDELSMVFQDPATSLDPTFGIGYQVAETVRAHRRVSRGESKARALALLREVGIPAAESRYADPPHRLSGGMRQRVVMAAALANDPSLLLADEPTTALDVTIQAQVLDLLAELQRKHGTTILLIAHDLGVVAQICDRVGVMYAGQLVEVAPVAELFAAPRHPYTRALLEALPSRGRRGRSLRVIGGQVPDLSDPPSGCRFADRCPHRMDVCATVPPLVDSDSRRRIACWLDPATRATAGLPPLPAAPTPDAPIAVGPS